MRSVGAKLQPMVAFFLIGNYKMDMLEMFFLYKLFVVVGALSII